MADYKIDGKWLRTKRGDKVAEYDGKLFRDAKGARAGEIDGKYIRDGKGKRIAEIDGDNIRVDGKRAGTMSDVRKAIDGAGGTSLAGFWVLFVR